MSLPITEDLNPGAYSSILSNTENKTWKAWWNSSFRLSNYLRCRFKVVKHIDTRTPCTQCKHHFKSNYMLDIRLTLFTRKTMVATFVHLEYLKFYISDLA